jgi:hypothetical protein
MLVWKSAVLGCGGAYSLLLREVRPPLVLERAVVSTLRDVEGRDMASGGAGGFGAE